MSPTTANRLGGLLSPEKYETESCKWLHAATAANTRSKIMNFKRAEECGFECGSCKKSLHKIGKQWGCLNANCFYNYHQVAYRVKLGLIPKNRL